MKILTDSSLAYFWNKIKAALSLKQEKITSSGLLKGNGAGAVSAAVPGTDYISPAGGTMTNNLISNNPAIATSAMRNISASTTDLTAGTSALTTGAIYLVYE